MAGKVAIAVPYHEFRGLTALLFKTHQALWYACARAGRPTPLLCPVKDGEVSYARAVSMALAHQSCRDEGDRMLSADCDMAIPPATILAAGALATPERVVVIPYRKRQLDQQEWCFALPRDADDKPVLRMHLRQIPDGPMVRTFEVTRAGLGGQAIHPDAYSRVIDHHGARSFYFDLGANGPKGYAAPVFDPHYQEGELGRLYRYDDSYTWCVRALKAGLALEALLDMSEQVAHGELANGSELETELAKMHGYIQPERARS